MHYLLTILSLLIVNPFSTITNNDPVEIVIESNDQMQFDLKEITVSEGDVVRLTLKHVGQLPEAAMGHNWVLLAEGTDVAAFGQAAIQARATDYVPEGSDEVIVATELIGGGEETTIEFEVPAPGTYTFVCSFPGHYALMNGTFIVE